MPKERLIWKSVVVTSSILGEQSLGPPEAIPSEQREEGAPGCRPRDSEFSVTIATLSSYYGDHNKARGVILGKV